MLIINTNAEDPGVPKSFWKGFSKYFAISEGIPRETIKSAHIKNGNKAGSTESAHRAIPLLADPKTKDGKKIIEIAMMVTANPAGTYLS